MEQQLVWPSGEPVQCEFHREHLELTGADLTDCEEEHPRNDVDSTSTELIDALKPRLESLEIATCARLLSVRHIV